MDTNILIAALVRDSLTRSILLNPNLELFTPEYVLVEIQRHTELISKKSGLDPNHIELVFSLLTQEITVVPQEEIAEALPWAEELIGDIDKKDVPFLALAAAIKADGIWTMDKHFRSQNEVEIWTTEDLKEHLKTLDSE